jgi:hypothetical protein
MASVHREVRIERPVAAVWDALADVGALHTRLVPGFVTDCRLERARASSPLPTAWSRAS